MAVNEDLVNERLSATFKTEDVTSQLYGESEMYERRHACEYQLLVILQDTAWLSFQEVHPIY